MSIFPRFKEGYYHQIIAEEALFIASEQGADDYSNPVIMALAPLLNGKMNLEDLVEQLRDRFTEEHVLEGLIRLRRDGYLCDARAVTGLPPEQEAFWSLQGLLEDDFTDRLAQTRVGLHMVGRQERTTVETIVRELGLNRVDDWGDVCLVVCDDYLDPQLEHINRIALDQNKPWLLVKPIGTSPWIGPLFQPGETACWSCLAQRLGASRRIESYLAHAAGSEGPLYLDRAGLPHGRQLALGYAAQELLTFLIKDHSNLAGVVKTMSLTEFTTQEHQLVRRPQCPTCGDPGLVARVQEQPVTLTSRLKVSTGSDGGHRSSTPEQMLARLEHHISPITGAVFSIRQWYQKPEDKEIMPIFMADHNFAKNITGRDLMHASLRARSGGKGRTPAQSKASALGESFERYCGVYRGDEARRRSTLVALGEAGIDPRLVLGYSPEQYEKRKSNNGMDRRFNKVPRPFDPHETLEWTPYWSLTHQCRRYLPTMLSFYTYTEDEHREPIAYGDSNGCAGGSNPEEAILQGLLELVERDAVGICWYNQIRRPSVDLQQFDDPFFKDLPAYYAQRFDRDLWVLDVTNDLGIPTMMAFSCRKQSKDMITLGLGCHFNPEIALSRALTELGQSNAVAAGTAKLEDEDEPTRRWYTQANLDNQPHLRPDPSQAAKSPADYPPRPFMDIRSEIEYAVDLMKQKGLEVLVLNQSRPDIDFAVFRVVIPGLSHFWPRFGHKRLYQVPVDLDWRQTATPEAEMNSFEIFF